MDIVYSNDKGVKQSVCADSTKTSRLKEFIYFGGISHESRKNTHKIQKHESKKGFLQGRDPPRSFGMQDPYRRLSCRQCRDCGDKAWNLV